MRYTFDLTGAGMRRFQFFPEAVAAVTFPERLPSTLPVLVWGVVVREPEKDAEFCRRLPSRLQEALPASLYLSGWASLTFQGTCCGQVTVSPYRPVLTAGNFQFLTDGNGRSITISQRWPGQAAGGTEYLLSMVIEQPFGFMSLQMTAAGPVTLAVDPQDFVTQEQVVAAPDRYGYDFARVRQLRSILSHPGC